jgi:hypothetical protein
MWLTSRRARSLSQVAAARPRRVLAVSRSVRWRGRRLDQRSTALRLGESTHARSRRAQAIRLPSLNVFPAMADARVVPMWFCLNKTGGELSEPT